VEKRNDIARGRTLHPFAKREPTEKDGGGSVKTFVFELLATGLLSDFIHAFIDFLYQLIQQTF
jgi:hypothetical protein